MDELSKELKEFIAMSQAAIIELARVRELLREEFPDYAHIEYGEAQHNPTKVSGYYKKCFEEAKKKGRIAPPSVILVPSQVRSA